MTNTEELVAQLHKNLEMDGRSWVKLKTMLTLVGREKSSPTLLAKIEAALEAAGIYHSPADLQYCQRDGTVLLATEPFHHQGLPFENEQELSKFIARHCRLLPPFRQCTSVEREATFGDLRVDLLFRAANSDRIACELEQHTGGHEAGSQIISYVQAVRDAVKAMAGPPEVRGVVITGAPNPRQEAMVAEWCNTTGANITWYYYRLGLELTASE